MTNIRAVSKLAGVSVATVSRALQKPELVSEKTREKVKAAAQEADYKPNMMAVNFRSRKSHAIMVLVPDVSNVFFSKVISGIQAAAKAHGYNIILGNTMGDEGLEQELANMLQTNQADGIIQLSARFPLPKTDLHGDSSLPIVNCCECVDDASMPTVSLDNQGAGTAVTKHLLELGHKRIGAILGPSDSPLTSARLNGYRSALNGNGIAFDESLLAQADFTIESGYKAVDILLDIPSPPTAVFCFSDEMAIGAIKRVKERGLKVPEDISIAGFDDLEFSGYIDPPLTTIKQPNRRFGAKSVETLLDIIEGRAIENQNITLPFELLVRSSTATLGAK
jgi:LacI family repressor for deo operon, udp, cdd, tsx, nupC, and nupG